MYKFSIGAIFKNEYHILEEWILHYKNHGINHLYLINDNSNDNYLEILNKYSSFITLFHNDINTNQVGRQNIIYEKYFRSILIESEWFGILDLDEFLYSPIDINLINIIDKYNIYNKIIINWVHFGSNSHLFQPQSVVEGFLSRAKIDNTKRYYSTKALFKSNSLISFNIHDQIVIGNEIRLESTDNNYHDLIINHYCIQSQEFYLNIKSTRGDVNNWFDNNNLKRDISLFNEYDINDIYDDKLYLQNKNFISIIKDNKISNSDDVTLIITSCNRPDLLDITLNSFIFYNTFTIYETFIIDDSGIIGCIDNVINKYKDILDIKSIYNKKNIGQVASIDKVYSYVKTKYIFHCEDDWQFINYSFIEKSLYIFNSINNDKLYTIWLRPHECTSNHPIIYDNENKGYYKMHPTYSYEYENKVYIWCGMTFNPGLRKTKDCLLFHPYYIKTKPLIKNDKKYYGEYNINLEYLKSEFFSVILSNNEGHVKHIGKNHHIQRPEEI